MNEIIVRSKRANVKDIKELEQLGVIKRFLTPEHLCQVKEGDVVVQMMYSTNIKYGSHKLMYINNNRTESELGYHPDKEDIFLIKPHEPTKPLIWVFCKYSYKEIEKKIRAGNLSKSDFVAFDIPFNDPEMSIFTVNEYFPHYEVTIHGTRRSPSFWVTEPATLPLVQINLYDYKIKLEMD